MSAFEGFRYDISDGVMSAFNWNGVAAEAFAQPILDACDPDPNVMKQLAHGANLAMVHISPTNVGERLIAWTLMVDMEEKAFYLCLTDELTKQEVNSLIP